MTNKNYKELDQQVDSLFAKGKFHEALDVLIQMKKPFPEELHATLVYMLACYEQLKKPDEMIRIINEALGQRIFFRLSEGPFFLALKDHPDFPIVLNQTETLRNQFQKKSSPQYRVFLPEGYNPGTKYPLFLVLHGNGEDLNIMTEFWKPEFHTSDQRIAVYLQSSQVYSYKSYCWTDSLDTARKEIRETLASIIDQYSVDKNQVYIGGFSGGSIAALSALVHLDISVRGYIGLCPVDKNFLTPNLLKNRPFTFKAVILKGEHGGDEELGSIPAFLNEAGIPFRIITNKGMGHWFPADLNIKIRQAMEYFAS